MNFLKNFCKKEDDPFTQFEIIVESSHKSNPSPRLVTKSQHSDHDMDSLVTDLLDVFDANPDGTSRQEILLQCKERERVLLFFNRGKADARHTVKVCRMDGNQIGVLSPGTLTTIQENSKLGYVTHAYILRVGAGSGTPNSMAVSLLIVFSEKGLEESVVHDYAESVMTENQMAGLLDSID
jgi:hypothetical protein